MSILGMRSSRTGTSGSSASSSTPTAASRSLETSPGVPIGFPFELDDEQLDKAIAGMLEPGNWPGFDNFAQLLPELKIALVGAGLGERQARDQSASSKRALLVAYATLAVSLVALVIAVTTWVTTSPNL